MVATNTDVCTGDFTRLECRTVADLLSRVGDKWTVMVVGTLALGSLRYGELQKRLEGISQRMLTLTLKHLEEDGLVTRTVFPTIPPRVDYELTPVGRTLLGPLQALHAWTLEHGSTMLAARSAYAEANRLPAPSAAAPSIAGHR